MSELNNLREQIDNIDDKLLELINKRMQVVQQVGAFKHKSGGTIYRPEREKDILDRLKSQNNGPLKDEALKAIFLELIASSRNLELPEKIAFLGPVGSYTHQASQARFGAMGNYIPLATIEAVFKSLHNKEVKYAVVPFANNTDGVVGVTVDCLRDYDVKIVAELYMDIHHSFVSTSDKLEDIKTIYSHPQGYNQCRKFLEEHNLLEVEFVPTKSTAQAAKLAKKNPSSAAICSKIAAKIYDVPLFFDKIEDNLANRTRFFILSDFKVGKHEKSKTSILAQTANTPGSLADFLHKFKDENINITKIESRPIKDKDFNSLFYIDFEGHVDDEKVKHILNDKATQIKWLGSYVGQ
jgi:chorismate mutase/prephenate dehydratase